jgi:hypothetical protein
MAEITSSGVITVALAARASAGKARDPHVFPTSRTHDAAAAEVASSTEGLARKYVAQAMQAGFGRPRTADAREGNSNVQYIISDRPLTMEEWEAKHCTGN